MDGNGRWAKSKGKLRVFGHKNGVTAVRDTVEAAAEIGIKFLTLYAFSNENWNRPKLEVDALMSLLINSLKKELPDFMKNGVRINSIGAIENLPKKAQKVLTDVITETKNNKDIVLHALKLMGIDELVEVYDSKWMQKTKIENKGMAMQFLNSY